MEIDLLAKLKDKWLEVNDVNQEPFRKLMTSAWDKLLEKAPEAKVYLERIEKTQ